jgi:hypothetical protein
MGVPRIRRKIFDLSYDHVGPPMYWLSRRGVSRALIAELFGKTPNHVSVNATNQKHSTSKTKQIVLPAKPDISRAGPELRLPGDDRHDDLEARIETEAARFWSEVRGLAGVASLGAFLREINRPGRENIQRNRLKARVEHIMAEMYLHAGYLRTAMRYCRRSLATRHSLYKDTLYRTELFAYAKTMLLFTCILEVSGNLKPVLGILDYAEAAFKASKFPIDPELHRQRASAMLRQGDASSAREEYLLAYDAYPAHFEFRNLKASDHAQHDVGKRPFAILDQSYEKAKHNIEIARGWPEGDVHHSANINTAIATAFLTDSVESQADALKMLPAARVAAEGYGRQMTSVRLLELVPRIPREHQRNWVLFALHYNAYRNR